MAMTSASEAGALLHDAADHKETTVTPSFATPSDAPPPSKRQRRSIRTRSSTEEANCECHTNAAAPAAVSFQTESPPTETPPLRNPYHEFFSKWGTLQTF
eukprot:scaffold46181_cov96-Attheya_sp.AAC.2